MDNYQSHAGKGLIEMLMLSLYSDERIIFREYIQNGYDAIRAAAACGVLAAERDGIVTVNIDRNERCITIHDNGTGIPAEQVPATLLNIADSDKDGNNTAGQYGIGRLAGAGYCKLLQFKTTAKGESIATTITFNVEQAREIINDSTNTATATQIVDTISTLQQEPADDGEHYFEVRLCGVDKQYEALLNAQTVHDYLAQVAPVDYGMSFKRLVLEPALQCAPERRAAFEAIGAVRVTVNGQECRKQYTNKVEGTGDAIYGLDFFDLRADDGQTLAWGWYAITAFTKAIPISDPCRGIRLRKHNIQLGTAEKLNAYFTQARGNNYFYGEIFAVHPALRPSSNRDGLAPTHQAEILQQQLRSVCPNLTAIYEMANKYKNAKKREDNAIEKQRTGLETDKTKTKAEIDAAKGEQERIENSKAAQQPAGKVVIDILKHKNDKQQQAEQESISTTTKTIPIRKPKASDLLAPLTQKFSESEITLIRRTFGYLTQSCPPSMQNQLTQMKAYTVQQLLTR